jgi:ribose/xylose/arabinose/galactoside ABC-type transport system permease subunit
MMRNKSNTRSLKAVLLSIQPVNLVFVVMLVYFSIATPNFLSMENALSLARQGALLMILCMGVIVVKITGGMDLACGAIMTLAGMIMAWSMVKMNSSLSIACLLAVLTAISFGLLNGFIVSVMKIPSFIATIGTQGIAIGLALGINKGNVIGNLPEVTKVIGNDGFLGIPNPLLITLIVIGLSFILLNFTKFGMYVYAIGGNEEALKLAGKPVILYKILAYTYSGFTAGIAALILTSRNMAAQPTVGLGMEFQAFVGVVLGGSFMAGRGTVSGAVLGALVILILRNGLNLIGIPTYFQLVIFGSVLILAIIISSLIEQNAQKWIEG